ncbi:MAG: type II toxin-antitoxin system HicB family antitoxin [Chloroflexi bacterium]|nr:type II toxin-antitoxin system HicB family antitoxin [Chloroflexota bacterium]
MRYTVVYEQAPRNYAAYVPELPVILVVGKTLDELAAQALEAIALHLEEAGQVDDAIEVELVDTADYDGDVVTLAGERHPARSVLEAAGA